MPQDAFTIGYVVKELSALLTGGKISRVTQPDRDTLTLLIYTHSGNVKLDICLSARACRVSLTDRVDPPSQNPPSFCMLLRKYLQNAEIKDISQPPFERIVVFTFLSTSDFEEFEVKLYAEIMGKYSNLIAVKDGVILGALKTTSIGENTRRVLFAGAKYSPPAPQEKALPSDIESLRLILSSPSPDRAKQISEKVKGVAYSTALDMVESLGENPSAEDVNRYICGGQCSPAVIFKGGEPDDFKAVYNAPASRSQPPAVSPQPPSQNTEKGGAAPGDCDSDCDLVTEPFPTVLEAQKFYYDALYVRRRFSLEAGKLSSRVSARLKAVEKRLAIINKKLFDCLEAEEVRLKGELITANLYAIKSGSTYFETVNYYDEKGGTIKIALDPRLTPAQNAQKYFARYSKLKRTKEAVEVQYDEAMSELYYLKNCQTDINNAENLEDLVELREELGLGDDLPKKKKCPPPPFRKFDIYGFSVLAGRNNLSNDRLFKSLSSEDIWLHTQRYHSSHVAIICNGREAPQEVIVAAAQICAYYSEARDGNKVPVDYTLKKYVKKPPKAKAGFVVYTDQKTILVDPDSHKKESVQDR